MSIYIVLTKMLMIWMIIPIDYLIKYGLKVFNYGNNI